MKKYIALFLAIILVISAIPMATLAAGTTKISFETTFEDDMTVGDTFTVTANLKNNPIFLTATFSLKWNDEVVKFTGFDRGRRDALSSDVLIYGTVVANDESGIIACADTYGYEDNGKLFVANFEIIGSGDLELGLKNADQTEFQMRDEENKDVDVAFDYSAIEGLTVAGADIGPAIPDGAPFTAITTDAGNVIDIEQRDDIEIAYSGEVPYYHITIPEDATEVYVTDPDQLVMYDYNYQVDMATAYVVDMADYTASTNSYEFEQTDDGVMVIIPMEMTAYDMMYNEISVYFPMDEEGDIYYAFAGENSSYAATYVLTFEYGEAMAEGVYKIEIDEDIEGGYIDAVYNADGDEIKKAAAGDFIIVEYEADSGYTFKNILVNGKVAEVYDNGYIKMPAEDVLISAVFELIPPTTYDVTIAAAEHGTVTADKAKAEAGEKVSLTVAPADGYILDTLTVMQGETSVEVINNRFTMPAGAVTVTATFKAKVSGYTFATSADVSALESDTVNVSVKITGHSDSEVTKYNAYDVTLTFNSEKLEYVGYEGAVKADSGEVKVEGNTIHIVGCGADKDFGTAIATLTFQVKEGAEGDAIVEISKVQVSDKEGAVEEDAPAANPQHAAGDTTADETPAASVVQIPYSVEKPNFVSGSDKVIAGEDYTFSYTDTTNYTYSNLTVTVGGETVVPAEDNGVYTIENVQGTVVISATQTPNTYDVTLPDNVTGEDKATYGTDYVFTVNPSENMAIESVKVMAGETEIPYTINENGEYVIAGKDISGAFEIVVTEKADKTTITFTGVESDEVEGGLTHSADIGKDFTFKLNKVDGYDYTVKVGETEIEESADEEGAYTIPAELVVADGVDVTIEKVVSDTADVEVNAYINLGEGKTMFLVTATWGDKVLKYGEDTMFYSSKYKVGEAEETGAYCWLVIAEDSAEEVKEAAIAAITEAEEGTDVTEIKYNNDVNGTSKVDVNDAQLVYDMYNAAYGEFTTNLTMIKFLEADVNGSKGLDTTDVAAIVSVIVNN